MVSNVDKDLLSEVYWKLVDSEKDFFSNLSNDEIETCQKIADYFSDKRNPINVPNEDIHAIKKQIENYKNKKIKAGYTKAVTDKLHFFLGFLGLKVSNDTVNTVYKKFHPEQAKEGGFLEDLPLDIYAEILSQGAGFDAYLVSKKLMSIHSPSEIDDKNKNLHKDRIWKGIAQRIGCPPFKAEPGKYDAAVKQWCIKQKKEISQLQEEISQLQISPDILEISPDILELVKKDTTIESMKKLIDWRRARDTVVVMSKLGEAIGLDMNKMKASNTREQMVENAKLFPEWFEANKSKLVALEELNLDGQGLAYLPPEIGSLVSLKVLNLIKNQLTELPAEIGKLTLLERLEISYNQISELPQEIGNFKKLRYLILSNNLLSELPPTIGNLGSLFELKLDANKLQRLPPEFFRLVSMKRLIVSENQLIELPKEIGFLTNLTTLDLHENRLTTIPTEIRHLSLLKVLELSENQLTTLPSEIGSLRLLTAFGITRNQLKFLPSEIGNLASLILLYIDENNLSELPQEMAQLNSLKNFGLSINPLTMISFEIFGRLQSLERIFLDVDQFSKFPPELKDLLKQRGIKVEVYGVEVPD